MCAGYGLYVQARTNVCRLMCAGAVQVQATDTCRCRPRICASAGAYKCVQADMCRRGAGAGHGYVQATDMCRPRLFGLTYTLLNQIETRVARKLDTNLSMVAFTKLGTCSSP
jgi:hypothetical protein